MTGPEILEETGSNILGTAGGKIIRIQAIVKRYAFTFSKHAYMHTSFQVS